MKKLVICKSIQNRINRVGVRVKSVGKLEVLKRFCLEDRKWRNQLRNVVTDLIKLLK
jgi:hypothetical protein